MKNNVVNYSLVGVLFAFFSIILLGILIHSRLHMELYRHFNEMQIQTSILKHENDSLRYIIEIEKLKSYE